jgi:hypothetical protein
VDTNTASTTFQVVVRNVDNDAPVLGTIANQTTDRDQALVINVPVSDPDTALSDLVFFSSTAGTALVQSMQFNLTSSNTVSLTITPRPGATGTDTVTVSVSDGESVSRTSFTFTVRAGGPEIEPIANVQTAEDVNVTVRVNVTDEDTPLSQLVITGESSNSNLVTVAVQNTGTQVLATLNLVRNQFGPATITIRASDGTNVTTRSFQLVVIDVADPPVLAPIADTNVATGTTTVTVPLNVTDEDTPLTSLSFLSSTAGTDIVQSVTFNVTSTSAAAVITLRANASGTEAVTFTVTDGDSVVRDTFNLTVGGQQPGQPATLNVARTGTNITINVTGTAGATYVVEGTTNFTAWSTVRIIRIEQDGSNAVVIPASGRYQFFRVRSVASSDSLADVTQPGDAIVLVNGTNDGDTSAAAPPANEGVIRAIDNVGQKYLNFLDLGSGFTVTPSIGETVLVGLTLWQANDAPERDPASYRVEGANNFDGTNGTFTLISEGPVTLGTNRNAGGFTTPLTGTNFTTVSFPNSTPYTSYRITFPTLRNAATANSMQIAEVDLIGQVR